MRKLFYFAACLFCSFILFSCSSGVEAKGEVSLSISNASIARIAARASGSDSAAKSDFSFKVKLTADNKAREKTAFVNSEKNTTEISFSDIPVGVEAKVEAWLYNGDDEIASGTSNTFKVKDGKNSVTLQLKVSGDKVGIEFEQTKRHFEIRTIEGTDTTFYSVSGGTIKYSLFDEYGNNVLAGINWDEEDSQYVWKRIVEIHYPTETEDSPFDNFSYDNNEITFNYDTPSRIYYVTITVSPLSGCYVNTSGDTVMVPDFEPITETFEIYVEPSV